MMEAVKSRRTQKTPLRREQGASHSRLSLADRFAAYREHHVSVAVDSFQRLMRSPMASLMTWMVIGIALALPAGFYVALGNLDAVGRGWDGSAHISLFLEMQTTDAQAQQLVSQLGQRADILDVKFISRDQALQEFRQLSGYGDVLQSLDSNPLPAVIIISPDTQENSALAIETLMAQLQALPQVAFAQLDLEWVQRLFAMMRLGQRLTAAVAVLLALGVMLVIGNTIRLAIENRRDEILVIKLVGGTDAFVRRPFLYTGFWYGLGGGIIAWVIINIALLLLRGSVAELAGLYESEFTLLGLNVIDTIGLWVTGSMLGLLGAWLAVMRHLDDIEPR